MQNRSMEPFVQEQKESAVKSVKIKLFPLRFPRYHINKKVYGTVYGWFSVNKKEYVFYVYVSTLYMHNLLNKNNFKTLYIVVIFGEKIWGKEWEG